MPLTLFNLETVETYKLNREISLKAGGRFSVFQKISGKALGIGGMKYVSGLALDDRKNHTSNVEVLKNGLLFYFRANFSNFAFVVPFHDIYDIQISKPEDVIATDFRSMFGALLKMKSNYLTARRYLLEHESINFHPIIITIDIIEHGKIELEITKVKAQKVIDFWHSLDRINVKSNIEGFKLVT